MQEYNDLDYTISKLNVYLNYMAEYAETREKLEDVDMDELTNEDLAYYY